MGNALLEALSQVFNTTSTSTSPRRVILGGHDRGARIAHRLAVDFSHPPQNSSSIYSTLNLTVLGTILLDIVPTQAQWQAFSDPAIVSGYFHWPLLANADIATEMIAAYGGGRWASEGNLRIAGANPNSVARLSSNGALEVYRALFDQRETIYFSSLDYAAGATTDVTQQEADQKAGRKVGVPLLVMFSKAKLGARIDVQGIWKDWVAEGVDYVGFAVGDGYGHYLPEEAFEVVSDKIDGFLKKVLAT